MAVNAKRLSLVILIFVLSVIFMYGYYVKNDFPVVSIEINYENEFKQILGKECNISNISSLISDPYLFWITDNKSFIDRIYPLPYSFPFKKIQFIHTQYEKYNSYNSEMKLMSIIIPKSSQNTNYSFYEEQLYYEEYIKSCFAITNKKIGWDSLRHYEILGCGTIPIFNNIHHAPKRSLITLPKGLLQCVGSLYYKYINVTSKLISLYNNVSPYFRQYTLNYLTCMHAAKYLIKIMEKYINNTRKIKKVLFLHFESWANYHRELMLIGLYSLLNLNGNENQYVIDIPKIPRIYIDYHCPGKTMSAWKCSYGRCFSYCKVINDTKYIMQLRKNKTFIQQHIKNHIFDIVVYARLEREHKLNDLPMINLTKTYYNKNEIAFLWGGDASPRTQTLNTFAKFGVNFVRELR